MFQRFSCDEQQVKIPNQRSSDRFLREESKDLFLDSDMVNLLLKTNGGRDRRSNFVGRQLFSDLVRCHSYYSSEDLNNYAEIDC